MRTAHPTMRIIRTALLGLTLVAFVGISGCKSPTDPRVPQEDDGDPDGNDQPSQGMIIDGYELILA